MTNADRVLTGDENVLESVVGGITTIYRRLVKSSVSVIIPAFNEERTIGRVVRTAQRSRLVREVLVIDDGSRDRTADRAARTGATVIRHGTNRGKGAALTTGLAASSGDIILFLDADMTSLTARKVNALLRPVMTNEADFVKAYFTRDHRTTISRTKPLYRPLLRRLFGVDFRSPLSGQFAARREFLETVAFEDGYGVDIGVLLDAVNAGLRIREVSLGALGHRRRTTADVERIADAVIDVITMRASPPLAVSGVAQVPNRAADSSAAH